MEQHIRYCTTTDGVRIAYTEVGEGPPLVRVLGWFTHLEYEWESPIWRPTIDRLAAEHRLVRYDGRGMGLSDRGVEDFSLDAKVRDLEAVVDALKLRRFALLGTSEGGPTAISYAVRHPQRVSHLILLGAFARLSRDPDAVERQRALQTLIRFGWGQDNPAYRQMFTSQFYPEGTAEQTRWVNEMQRASASPEDAARFFASLPEVDVTDLLPQVKTRTLVAHSRGDAMVSFRRGQNLAKGIPGARFLLLDSTNHAPLTDEPAGEKLYRALDEFVSEGRRSGPTRASVHSRPAVGDSAIGSPQSASSPRSGGEPAAVEAAPAHAVFLSYAAEDRTAAEAILTALEAAGLRCWIAPRDIRPGTHYAEAIVDAIDRSRLMVVVFSAAADASPHVARELEQATSAAIPIVPVRITDAAPSKGMRYFLATPHWLNAFPGPLEPHLAQLTETVEQLAAADPRP